MGILIKGNCYQKEGEFLQMFGLEQDTEDAEVQMSNFQIGKIMHVFNGW